jgi:hypothetical protein
LGDDYLWVLVGELVEVTEAGDWVVVGFADELPPPRLQDAADIGEGRLVAAESPNTSER